MQEIEKQPISINVTQDASGKMEQTSEEVVSQIKAELDKIGLPYSDVVANDKGSTYFVVTKDGQQHEILKLVKTGNALVKPILTKAKWINHLIKTQPQDLYNFVDAELDALESKPATPAVQPVPAATSENAIEAPDTPVGFFRKPGQKPAEKSVSSSPTSGFAALEALGFSQDMFQDAPQDVLDDIEKREQNLQKGEELNKKCNKGEK